MYSAIQQYRTVETQSGVYAADPHRLIQMLLQGAMDKIALAKGFMERGDVAEKGRHISRAISIVDGLRASLDKDKGGEIATNLESLYDYMERRLLMANLKNDLDALSEVADLLRDLKEAWDGIGQQVKPDEQPPARPETPSFSYGA